MKIKAPNIITDLPGPKGAQLVERDKNSISSSISRWYPLVAETGEGTTVVDVDGNNYTHTEYSF